MDLELDLPRDRSYTSPALRRSQQPKPPFPYESHELTAPTSKGFSLAGTLTIPKGEGPFPCAVLISGSGQQDRDETLVGHKPFLVLADHLSRNGIAVFRYDDRGVGHSGGRDLVEESTSKDFADDASAVIDMLKTQPGIDAKRIGLIGHSEGGLIAPMVATMRDDVAYLVLMAGPGVNGREILELQGRLILEAENTPDADVEEFSISQKKMLDMVIAGATTEELLAAYREMQDSPEPVDANEQPDDDSPALPDVAEARIKALNNSWMKFFLEYEPAPTLAKVKCPVLAINGTLDLQVWHNQNLPMIERAMRDAGGNVTIKRYENLNHLFQPAKTGGISEYGAIEITVDPAVLEDVTKWITLNTAPAN
jgi:pimeloyl-ACP methyl ester carboxylesterase